MSYQQCTRFRTTLDFDREYHWNGSSNRQAENGVINYDFFHVWWNQFCEQNFVHLWKKWPWSLTYDLDQLNKVPEVVEVHVRTKYHQAECSSSWVMSTRFFALSRNGEKSEHPVVNSSSWVWLVCELSWVQRNKWRPTQYTSRSLPQGQQKLAIATRVHDDSNINPAHCHQRPGLNLKHNELLTVYVHITSNFELL